MARISEERLQKIKDETDIIALIESYGTKLKQRGSSDEFIGLCPIHDDHDPSLGVNRKKREWNCLGACGCGGDVIKWVMHADKVSFREAVDLLENGATGSSGGCKHTTQPRLPCPLESSLTDGQLLQQVADFYQSRLELNIDAQEYLTKRGIGSADAVKTFGIGFCDRSLGLRIPHSRVKAGNELRTKLTELGVLRATGHEHLRGCVTFPVTDASGVTQIYGRRIQKAEVRQDGKRTISQEAAKLWLPLPIDGLWNEAALQACDEIIICESIIDALTFWCAGYRNVTTTFSSSFFPEQLKQALLRYNIKRVLLAYDNDEAGHKAVQRDDVMLYNLGLEVFQIRFPKGIDANDYALARPNDAGWAHDALGLVIRNADWLGKGFATPIITTPTPNHLENARKQIAEELSRTAQAAGYAVQSAQAMHDTSRHALASGSPQHTQPIIEEAAKGEVRLDQQPIAVPTVPINQNQSQAAKEEAATPVSRNALAAGSSTAVTPAIEVTASPTPAAPMETEFTITDKEISFTFGNRSYRIRGFLENAKAAESLKINLLVRRDELFHVDTFDLYASRARTAFIKEASSELHFDEQVIKRDLGKILLKLEQLQDKELSALQDSKSKQPAMSEAEQQAALELLQSPNLLDRILQDFDACGVVGEKTNKLVGYLAATSRKLEKPLAIVIQSSSAAGKSSLMEAILKFMPEEEQVNYSAMTGQSLFYMGDMELKHKILSIAEEEGVRQASYALKLLQSEGQLTIASTGKDPGTGRMETQEYHVEGPVMIFLTTTAIDIDEELLNRCLVLTVDEDPEQTRAIQRQQRASQTLDGLVSAKLRSKLVVLHQNAQRLLRPIHVVNPYAHQLEFLADQTRRRRDHIKYLTLIGAVTLLHQYQRPVKSIEIDGAHVQYIEVTPRDIQIANQLASFVLGRSIDELAPQTRRLLLQIFELARKQCSDQEIEQSEYRFTRRFLREQLGWGATQLRIHLQRLAEMEYVVVHTVGRGRVAAYELLFDGRGREGEPTLCGLIDPSKLQQFTSTTNNLAGPEGQLADLGDKLAGPKRPDIGPLSDSIGGTSSNETQGETHIDNES
jgi:DNA primase catalytic core